MVRLLNGLCKWALTLFFVGGSVWLFTGRLNVEFFFFCWGVGREGQRHHPAFDRLCPVGRRGEQYAARLLNGHREGALFFFFFFFWGGGVDLFWGSETFFFSEGRGERWSQ